MTNHSHTTAHQHDELAVIDNLLAGIAVDTAVVRRAIECGIVEALHIDRYFDPDAGSVGRVSITVRPSSAPSRNA